MKNNKVFIIVVILAAVLASTITAYATTYLYNSSEVSYDNSNSGISATNVQGAISELYDNAIDYNSMSTRVSALEGRWSSTGQTIKGADSLELNSNGTASSHGGYIDFHYGGSSSDYTSRIIENPSGVLNLQASNGVLINGVNLNNIITHKVLNSSNPITLPSSHGYQSVLVMGFVQGIGSVVLAITRNADVLKARDLINNTNFSNSYLTISLSDNHIVMTSPIGGASYLTIIYEGN